MGAEYWVRVLDGARRADSRHVHFADVLCAVSGPAPRMSIEGFCMEIRQTHVPAAIVPSCPGDSEVQCPGLQATHGAVPKGRQEGQAGAEDAEAEGVRVLSGG